MKIKPEHFDHIKAAIEKALAARPSYVEDYETGNFIRASAVNDLQKRFCYDVLYASGLTPWICENIYPYANDDHIYTVLKKVCPTVTRRY